jgi:hypothetical protein
LSATAPNTNLLIPTPKNIIFLFITKTMLKHPMESLDRFRIKVPEIVIDDLRARIKMTRWPDEVENAQWNYGTNLQYMKDVAQYWLEDFNWERQEQSLNSFNQYKAQIDDCSIHFVYERSKVSNAIPIIVSHGWPSSFTEMLKIIPMLTDPLSHGGPWTKLLM